MGSQERLVEAGDMKAGILKPVLKVGRNLAIARERYRTDIDACLKRMMADQRYVRPAEDLQVPEREGLEIRALLTMLDEIPLEGSDLATDWFNRLIGEVMLNLKVSYPHMPKELLDEIWGAMHKLRRRHPSFHGALSDFGTYEYDDMHYPYGKRRLMLADFMANTLLDEGIDFEAEMGGKKVAAVIPFFISGDEKFTERAKGFEDGLERLKVQTHKGIEICVFLNRCDWNDDVIRTFAKKYELRRVLASSENVGAAKARNEWIRLLLKEEGRPDLFLFMDDDTYLTDTRCIAKLGYHLMANPQFGGISPQIVHKNPAPGTILEAGYEPPWEFSAFPGFEMYAKENMRSGRIWKESFLLEGSCLMFSADTLAASKLYPEAYNYYHEETQLESMIRASQRRMNVVLQTVYATHQRTGGGSVSAHAMYYLYRNFAYLLQDIGVQKKNEAAYHMILSNFEAFCHMMIDGEGGDSRDRIRKRLLQACAEVESLPPIVDRPRSNEDFNADAPVRLIAVEG